jgi:hypothetical protein
MQTDRKPRKKDVVRQFEASDAHKDIRVPTSLDLLPFARAVTRASEDESIPDLQRACLEFLRLVSDFYEVSTPTLRLLGPRPHRTHEGRLSSELFGDYDLSDQSIRLWTRTPLMKKWTSSGVILSTICHELMHHLDVTLFDFKNTFHTVGFYERSHRLYLATIDHPYYPLKWHSGSRGSRVVNWPGTNRSKALALLRARNYGAI